jgi:type IV pilus assembly protein PilB
MTSEIKTPVTEEFLHALTVDQAWHYRIFPIANTAASMELYCEQSADISELQEELEILTGKQIRLQPIDASQLARLLSQHYIREEDLSTGARLADDYSSNHFLEKLIAESRRLKSSDVHIECYEEKCRVRIRIDGMLIERYLLGKLEYPSIINRIKILANLDIAEKRLPQDGRINFKTADHQFDIRVSVLPTLYGEKVVLRLLNNDATDIDLFRLGFSEKDLFNYLQGIKRPNGIVLISGPTGSGKTTTLYATLKLLNKNTRNILTIEDPIEYTLDGINQVQLKENIGLSFAAALKTFLRQDGNCQHGHKGSLNRTFGVFYNTYQLCMGNSFKTNRYGHSRFLGRQYPGYFGGAAPHKTVMPRL